MVPEVEENGEAIGVEFRDFGVTILERAARDLDPAIRTDLQKEAISGSKVGT